MQSEPVSPPPITTTCLPRGEDRLVRTDRLAGHAAILLRQEVHREMHAREVAAGHGQIARRLGAAGERDRVVLVEDAPAADGDADMDVAMKHDAFGGHLLDTPLDVALLELEVGNAVAQQPARIGVLFIDVDFVAGARELLGAGEPGRT